MRYKVTISTTAADFNFERSANLISIGRCEEEFPYSIRDDKLIVHQATTECVDAMLSLGLQMQIDVTSRGHDKDTQIKELKAENKRLQASVEDLQARLSGTHITLDEARENAINYARDKAHDQLKRIYEITME
jgi:regulator of replication initiation timing